MIRCSEQSRVDVRHVLLGCGGSSVEAVRSTCKVRASHPGDAAPTGYPYGDLVRPFEHLSASPLSEPDRNQGRASHARICRPQPSSGCKHRSQAPTLRWMYPCSQAIARRRALPGHVALMIPGRDHRQEESKRGSMRRQRLRCRDKARGAGEATNLWSSSSC